MTKHDRRSFLRTLLALPIAATLDVEKLLWVPTTQIVVPTLPADAFLLHVSTAAEYAFTFSGFKAADIQVLARQILPVTAQEITHGTALRMIRHTQMQRHVADPVWCRTHERL